MMKPVTINMHQQQGVVLVIALVLLLTLTLVAVGSMSTSNLEQKMSANMRDRQVAFQAAEAALRRGERELLQDTYIETWFNTSCTGTSPDGRGGLCLCTKTNCPATAYWTNNSIWSGSPTPNTFRAYDSDQLGTQPAKYIIEYRGRVCGYGEILDGSCNESTSNQIMYRITAIGYGQSTGAKVMLQSTFLKVES